MAGKGTLTVRILGDASGFSNTLDGVGGKLGQFGKMAVAATAAAAAAAGVALFKMGGTLDEAFDTIRVGTGATGQALEGLKDDFRAVAKTVPADMGSVGQAIADLNTRTGLSGEALQELAGQTLELSRLTKTDLGSTIAGTTRIFGDWAIATEDQAGTLDKLFRASQTSGIGLDKLMTTVVNSGAPLRQMGFGFEASVAMLAKFEKEGVNTEAILGGMKMALGRMAKAGEEPVETFKRLSEQIKQAGSDGAANAIAVEAFGTRAGPDLAAAIREGRFEFDDYLDVISNGSDTIQAAADDTADFGEAWLKFKNNVLLKLEPVAMRVFNAIGDLMTAKVMPALAALSAWWDANGPAVQARIEEIGAVVRDVLVAAFTKLSDWWAEHGPAITAAGEALWTGLQMAFDGIVSAIEFVIRNWDAFKIAIGIGVAIMIPHWVALAVAATVSAAKQAAAWVMTKVNAISAAVVHSAQVAVMTAKWALMGAQALLHAAKVVAGWAMTAAAAVANVAVHVAQGVVFVAKWALMGTQSLIHAAKIAAAWMIAMGPIAIVTAAVIAVVALIVANWDTIKRVTLELWNTVKAKTSEAVTALKTAVSDGINAVAGFFTGLPGRILGALGSLGGLLTGAGRALMDGLLNGIRAAWERVAGFLGGLASKIRNLKGPIEKDRKLLVGEGMAVMEGFGVGLGRGWAGVERMLSDMTASLPQAAAGSLRGVGSVRQIGTDGAALSGKQVNVTITGPVTMARPLDERELAKQIRRAEVMA